MEDGSTLAGYRKHELSVDPGKYVQSGANGACPVGRILKYEWAMMGNQMNVDAHELQTRETDDRGRLYLGTEYANKRVTVAVVEVEPPQTDEEALAAAYRDAAESADRLAEEWDAVSDEAWAELDG